MIKTARLNLVPIDYNYLNDLYEIWSDFEVIKFTYITQTKNLAECNNIVERLLNDTDYDVPNHFMVLLNNKAIGTAGLPIINKDNSEYGFYYHYGRAYWGNGYATEVAKALLDYIFDALPNATIHADAVSINQSSMQVLKKAGFHQTYIESTGFQRNGYVLDLVHFTTEFGEYEELVAVDVPDELGEYFVKLYESMIQ